MGWFRDVRLRRSADAFLKSSKMYQQANAHWESEYGGYGFEKPSQAKVDEYAEELKKHIEQLQGRLKVTPNNDRREINIKSAGHGKVIGKEQQKLKEAKERAKELAAKPNSVIKATVKKKRRGLAAKKGKTDDDM